MLQMKLCGDLILREKCAPVTDITPELLKTLDEMVQMMNTQNGVGLAAPQVGLLQQFLVMMNPDTKDVFKMINPRVIAHSEDKCMMEEGCLSVLGPDGLPVYAHVMRPAAVDVEWMNERGEILRARMSDLMARVVQHETDHLNGVLFIDYLSPLRREMLMRKVRKYKPVQA